MLHGGADILWNLCRIHGRRAEYSWQGLQPVEDPHWSKVETTSKKGSAEKNCCIFTTASSCAAHFPSEWAEWDQQVKWVLGVKLSPEEEEKCYPCVVWCLSFCFPTPELGIKFIHISWHYNNFLKLREFFPQQSLISNIPVFIKAHELSRSLFFP